MMPRLHRLLCWLLAGLVAATGCHPTQPFYLHEDGDLSHYLEHATALEYADLETEPLEEVTQAHAPLTVRHPVFREFWDLTLEEAIHIALQNSKVIRNLGSLTQFTISDGLVGRTALGATVYDPAIFETDPQLGVAAALSAFDAQFTTSVFWQKTDRPQNVTPGFIFTPIIFQQDLGQFDASITKRTATGTTFAFRNQTIYDLNNRGFGRNLPSDWFLLFGVQAVQPLLRDFGTQVNRAPVIIARIRTDISLYDFRAAVRNMLMDLESAYWDLHFAYRALQAAQIGRDSALTTWQIVKTKLRGGQVAAGDEAQVREQYFFFRAQTERALKDLFNFETRLRWLMGLAPTDGRLIRPVDEPSVARIDFDWAVAHAEAQMRNEELNRQRWVIKQREQELIVARNQLLPQLNLTLDYNWIGFGDELARSSRNGIPFPFSGSTAWEELTRGNYQEARLQLDFTPPRFGARRELAGIQNAKLNLIRETARLEDMELNVTHVLTTAIQNLEFNYQTATTHLNRWKAAGDEVQAMEALYRGDKITLDRVLEAQRRRSQAMIDYYQAIIDYNKSIADVHFRKGSLLEHNNVKLAEGPWSDKAYWDALERARERDASYYWEYGYTRPGVVSRGAADGEEHLFDGALEGPEELVPPVPGAASPQSAVPQGSGARVPRSSGAAAGRGRRMSRRAAEREMVSQSLAESLGVRPPITSVSLEDVSPRRAR